MKQLIFNANNDWSGFILRLTIGLILFPHGAQKLLGWFGGPGFREEMEHLQHMHIPWVIALMVILIEFFGTVSLLIGFASRLWGLAFVLLFTGIIFIAHIQNGFFMNWFGNQQGEGFEYHLLVIGLCLALVVNGSGRMSVDRVIGCNEV